MTTKKKSAKAGGKSQDFPLDNIPERRTKTAYSLEFKQKAAERVNAGEAAEAVARELGVSNGSLIAKWARLVRDGKPLTTWGGAHPNKEGGNNRPLDIAATLMASLTQATTARDQRLEAAASIVAMDAGGKEGEAIAKAIRAFKRNA